MVIEDSLTRARAKNQRAKGGQEAQHRLASPVDRLGAAIIDVFVVLWPLLLLVAAPAKKAAMLAIHTGESEEFILASAVMVVCGFTMVVCYQTITTNVFGATLGKLFFGLRVESVWAHKTPSWGASFQRAFFWALQLCCLGLPFLSILTNRKRRPPHDRLADTIVVSKRRRGVGEPSSYEKSLSRGVALALGVLISALVVGEILQIRKQVLSGMVDMISPENFSVGCSYLEKERLKWRGQAPDRLDLAMALFAAGELDLECLEKEADLSFLEGGRIDLAYLAQSFVHADNGPLSNTYLKKVCEVDSESESCHMSQVVEHWSKEDWQSVDREFLSLVKRPSLYISAWAIRHLIRQGHFQESLHLIDRFDYQGSLFHFALSNRVYAYWGMGQYKKADLALHRGLGGIRDSSARQISSWVCFQKLSLNCETGLSSFECQWIEPLADLESHNEAEAMSALKIQKCREPGEIDLEILSQQIRNPSMKKWVQFQLSFDKDSDAIALSSVQKFAAQLDSESLVREEVLLWWFRRIEKSGDINEFYTFWKSQRQGGSWAHWGHQLMKLAYQNQLHSTVVAIGKVMNERLSPQDSTYSLFALSAHRLGMATLTHSLLDQYLNLSGEPPSRQPASEHATEFSRLLESYAQSRKR